MLRCHGQCNVFEISIPVKYGYIYVQNVKKLPLRNDLIREKSQFSFWRGFYRCIGEVKLRNRSYSCSTDEQRPAVNQEVTWLGVLGRGGTSSFGHGDQVWKSGCCYKTNNARRGKDALGWIK